MTEYIAHINELNEKIANTGESSESIMLNYNETNEELTIGNSTGGSGIIYNATDESLTIMGGSN